MYKKYSFVKVWQTTGTADENLFLVSVTDCVLCEVLHEDEVIAGYLKMATETMFYLRNEHKPKKS